MADHTILVTGAGALLGQGIIRSLRWSGLDLKIVAVDPDPLAAGLVWADSQYRVPMASSPSYMQVLTDLVERERPSVIIPGTDVELGALSLARSSLERDHGAHVLVADPQTVAIADDKFRTAEELQKLGFSPPKSALPPDVDELISQVGFPLIVKPRVGARSVGVSRVTNLRSLQRALDSPDGLMVQECIATANEEFTASALRFGEPCVASIVMRRVLRDGNTFRAFVTNDDNLNNQVRAMADALDVWGPVNFQFRLDGGTARVFEINARFSGTTPLRALAGFNEVDMALRRLLFDKPIEQPEIAEIAIVRHMEETIIPTRDVP